MKFDGSHLFEQKEFQQLRKHIIDALVMGEDTDHVAKIAEDANKFMQTDKVTLIELPSESAIQRPSQLSAR